MEMIVDILYNLYTLHYDRLCQGILILCSCVFLHVIIKRIWTFYITYYCITDSELSHLPIPPGTLGYPFIGETIEFIRKNDKFYKSRQQKYGNVYRTHVLGRPTVRVAGAHNLRKILMSEHSYVSSQWPPSFRIVLGPNALSMMDDVQKHKDRKRLLINLFLPDALNAHIPTIQSTVRQYIKLWCKSGRIYGYPECKSLSFAIATKTLAGFDCDEEMAEELSSIFKTMVENMFSLPVNLPGFGLYKALKAKKRLLERVKENIDKIQNTPIDAKKNVSALDYLIREEDEDSRNKTCESIVELMFVSHDTTASALCSCLMYLGRNPHVIEKIRDEVVSIDQSDNMTLSDLEKYRYVYNVTKEVLRLAPSVGAGYRRVIKSFQLEGYKIPKGWTVAYGIRDTHHTSPVYFESNTFNPDRWDNLPNYERMSENNLDERFNFATFGGGPRTCIGKEFAKLVIRLFLIEICTSCDWALENKDADICYIPVPRAVDNLPLTVKKRSTG